MFVVGSTVFYLIATILMFIFLTITYVNVSNSEYSYMYKIGENWQRGPIVNVSSDSIFCSGDTTPLITDMWQGIQAGCYCTFSLDFYGPLRRDYCRRSRDNYSFCSSVAPISPIDYKVWRGAPICANRESTNYLQLNIAKNSESCDFGTKSCGIIDSLDNVLCVHKYSPCPINYVDVISNDQTPKINFEYTSFNLTDGNKMIFSNENPNGKIYSEFIISEGQPCADPSRKNFVEMPYLLDPYYSKSDCENPVGNYTNDYRYEKIDSYDSRNLLSENNIYPLVQRLPLYPYQSKKQVGLYTRGYIGLNPTCLQEIRDEGIIDNIIYDLLDINDYMGYVVNLSLAAMIAGIFLLLFVIFTSVIIMCCKFDDSELKGALLFYIAPFILALGIFILTTIVAMNLHGYTSQTNILTRQECVDDITWKAANSFEDNIKSAYSISITSTSISGILFLMPVVFFVMMCCFWN
jgi:hypothetical protein